MLKHIREYISIQTRLIRAIEERDLDVWNCYETDVLGWDCNSHGEHICCIERASGAQVELPLLTDECTGVDVGHFIYYLKSIGRDSPSYSEMNQALEELQRDGKLVQVQKTDVPIVWGVADGQDNNCVNRSGEPDGI